MGLGEVLSLRFDCLLSSCTEVGALGPSIDVFSFRFVRCFFASLVGGGGGVSSQWLLSFISQTLPHVRYAPQVNVLELRLWSLSSFQVSRENDLQMMLLQILAANDGEVEDNSIEAKSFTFKGNGVEKLTKKLKEERNMVDVIVCTRGSLNGKPLRLQC
uniref:Uncharacterized protein n=1 Tax=Brassica oleracea var. oleracea TaxID=109376 RepID=A0A0D3BV19_BRAOL